MKYELRPTRLTNCAVKLAQSFIHMDTLKPGSHFWIRVFDEKFVIVHPAGTTLSSY